MSPPAADYAPLEPRLHAVPPLLAKCMVVKPLKRTVASPRRTRPEKDFLQRLREAGL